MEAGLVVAVGGQTLEVVVVRVLHVNAIRALGKGDVDEAPVLGLLNMENTTVAAGKRASEGSGSAGHLVAIDDDLFILVGRDGVGLAGRSLLGEVDILGRTVGSFSEVDGVTGLSLVNSSLNIRHGRTAGARPAAGAVRGNENFLGQNCRQNGKDEVEKTHDDLAEISSMDTNECL